jgi:hypothetical protein
LAASECSSKLVEVEKAHDALCTWVASKGKGAVRSSEPAGGRAIRLLKTYASALESNLPGSTRDATHIQISKGKSNLPSVLWVAVIPKYRNAYNSMSVATCFGAEGEGSVIGLMDAVTFPRRWLPVTKRDVASIRVNLNAAGSKFKYNDKFHNPKEFLRDDFSPQIAIEHIVQSVALLLGRLEEIGK